MKENIVDEKTKQAKDSKRGETEREGGGEGVFP